MAKTEENPLSVILGALAQGVGKLPVEIEKQKTVRARNAFQNMNLQQQMADQQLQQQKFDMDKGMNKLQQQELTERIRQLAMTANLTPETQHKMNLELIKARADADLGARKGLLDYAHNRNITTSGNKPGGSNAQATAIAKIIPLLTGLSGQNAGIAKTNAAIQAKNSQAQSDYIPALGGAPPVPTDTIPHINLSNTIAPFLPLLGADSAGVANILGGLQQPQVQPVQFGPQQKSLNDLTIEDIMNMSDEELQALAQ